MGLFDFFKRIFKSHTETKKISNQSTYESSLNDFCSENAQKKHFLMYILLDPETCFFKCQDLKEKGKIDFFYKDHKIYTMGNDVYEPISIFSILIHNIRTNQDDFTRFFEILNRNHLEYYSSTLLLSPDVLVDKIKYYFPYFSLGNDPNEIKATLEWTYIDIRIMHKFFLEISQYLKSNLYNKDIKKIENISDCMSLEDLMNFFLCIYQSYLNK